MLTFLCWIAGVRLLIDADSHEAAAIAAVELWYDSRPPTAERKVEVVGVVGSDQVLRRVKVGWKWGLQTRILNGGVSDEGGRSPVD